ncbi:MAG: type II secretion system F family protein [Flavobacteriaceae bacterium]|nr:type II secretion system F family protein [Flavobacteriaceae bacterium]
MAFQLDNIPKKQLQKQPKKVDTNSLLKKEIHLFGSSFSNKKKEAFYIELNVLLEAGLTLKDALSLAIEEQKKEPDKKRITSIVNDLIEGKSFAESIKKHKEFSLYEYYSIKIGEETGTIQQITKELGDFFKRKNEQRRVIVSALSYPAVVLLTALIAVFFMLKFVVPMFADIFKQNKVELPWITKVILSASQMFQQYYLIGLFVIVSIFLFIRLSRKKTWYKKATSRIVARIPFVGEFIRKVRIAQFTQALTLLTSAKVPLLNGIKLTIKMVDYYPLQIALSAVEKDILVGKSLHESIQSHKVFDSKMKSLVKVAEQTNQNETIFQRLTDQYNQEIEYQSKMISATIEPLIILFLGGIVALILIAMYMPMFKLSTVIG